MSKPRILLSGNKKLQDYVDAVEGTGGIAFAKYLPDVDTDYDGLILCGGNDIDPFYYGEEMNGSVDIDGARDAVEFALLKAFVNAGKPVMGICRGCQLLNVYFGGTLHQHIINAAEHVTGTDEDLLHGVIAAKGSVIESLYGTDFKVNSFHHQAIKDVGQGLKITMMSSDNTVIEGVEHESLPVFAVQWHPERLCFSNRRPDTIDGAEIFKYFLQQCQKYST